MKYFLGFDVETSGEFHAHQLMSVAFSLVNDDTMVVDQHLFIITPHSGKIDAEDDYEWSPRCWEEFGRHHIDTINATQNTMPSENVTRVSLTDAPYRIREYFDEVCREYQPTVGVDNAAYDCLWVSRLFTSAGLQPLEYQAREDSKNMYCGVIGYSSALRYLPKGIITVTIPNDHNPLNDSLRHALFLRGLEHLRKTIREV